MLEFTQLILRQRLLAGGGHGSFLNPGDVPRHSAIDGANPGHQEQEGKGKKGKGKGDKRKKKGSDQQENAGTPVVKHNKKVSNKITTISSKLTEVRCMMTQVNQSTMCLDSQYGMHIGCIINMSPNCRLYQIIKSPHCAYSIMVIRVHACTSIPRTDAMKAGYTAELTAHQDKFTDIKGKLEEFYAARHEDKLITGDLKNNMDSMMTQADAAVIAFTAGSKIIKSAVVLWHNFRGTLGMDVKESVQKA